MSWLKETLRAKFARDSRLQAQVEEQKVVESEEQAKIREQWEKVASQASLTLGKWKELEVDRILEDLQQHLFGGQLSFLALAFEVRKGPEKGPWAVTDILLGETDKGWMVKHQHAKYYHLQYTDTGRTIAEALSRSQFKPDEVKFVHITRGLSEEYEYEHRTGHPDNWGTRKGQYTLFRLYMDSNDILCGGKLLAPIEDVKGVKDLESRIDRFIAESLDKT